ncbi:hypothetical protein [Halospeciosus flavus]|uniref:Uncharacterized protein n=1 Tax=Halospeciosus flavus TaxID=3032283 RepID=A0ABD5Z3Y6_9EURY|nr:hypothetical protein [Halospeciosus flavus]
MAKHVWRVYATLEQLSWQEEGQWFTTRRISTIAALSIGETERALEYLEDIGGTESSRDGELEFALTDTSMEDLASRHDSIEDLDRERRTALLDALDRGDVSPQKLYNVDEAREAADRALGSQTA